MANHDKVLSPPETLSPERQERIYARLNELELACSRLDAAFVEEIKKFAGGSFPLKLIPEEVMERLRAAGENDFAGGYIRAEDQLVFPEGNPSEIGNDLQAKDGNSCVHEGVHLALDPQGETLGPVGKRLGFIQTARTDGPKVEELLAHAAQKIADPAYDLLRERLLVEELVGNVTRVMISQSPRVAELIEELQGAFTSSASEIDSLENMNGVEAERLEAFSVRRASLLDSFAGSWSEGLLALQELIETGRPVLSALSEAIDDDTSGDLVLSDPRRIALEEFAVDLVEGFNRTLGEGGEIHSGLAGLSEEIDAESRAAEERSYELMRRELAEGLERTEPFSPEWEAAKARLEEFEAFQERIAELRATTDALGSLFDGLAAVNDRIELLDEINTDMENSQLVRDVLEDPEEVFARIVDGVYSLYFGEPRLGLLVPDSSDLALLERVEVNGEPMFKAGVEKYRLAAQMIADGQSEKAVRAQLLDAQAFEYNGTTYHWPRASIELNAEDPFVKW